MRLLVGKAMLLIPFGITLICQPALASRVAQKLSGVVEAWVLPMAQLAAAGQNYDPFAVDVPPVAALVMDESDDEQSGVFSASEEPSSAKSGIAGRTGKPSAARSRRSPSAGASPLPSIRVSEATVLRLAATGQRPTGKPVAASGNRPAGIQIFGAAALGIGVRDGDVLTHVSAVHVSSVGQVIALVIAARGARQPAISGKLWRGQRSYGIVVEQPYPSRIEVAPASPERPSVAASGTDSTVTGTL